MTSTAARLAALLTALVLAAVPGHAAGDDSGSDYVLDFHAGPVDPAVDLEATDPAGEDLVLVQWEDFGDEDVVAAIAATGALLVQPLAPVSYLVWADADRTDAIRALDGVRFAGVLPGELRLAPSVDEETTALRVTFVGEVDPASATGLNVLPRGFAQLPGTVVVMPGALEDARALAAQPRTYSVADAGTLPQLRDEQSAQIVAQGTEDAAHRAPGYRDFLAAAGADGTGVRVAIVDGGVDFNHPDLAGQVAACFDYGVPGLCELQNNDDAIGHGTHVLGVALGAGATAFTDLDGFNYGLGTGPGAKAVVQNAISLNTIPTAPFDGGPFRDGYTPVYTDAVRAGATISNNSWGPAGTPQGYDAATREFDMIARDADPQTPGDQPITLSWSIMNGSGGRSTQGSPDEAKNILAVGGSGARQATALGEGHGEDDLCRCTAHGPNLDGRRLVDVVAPAENVVSARASQGVLCGSGATGLSPATGPWYVMEPPSPIHGPCTGTSFASPHASGAAAVFTEFFRTRVTGDGGATPSPALVKAAFVNGADDLTRAAGRDANGLPLAPVPNDQQGWGRLNLGNVLEAWGAGAVWRDQAVAFTGNRQSHTLQIEPLDPSRPLKVTLAWSDAPGHGMGGSLPAWVNDLDLTVTGPDDQRWLGNSFAGGWSATDGAPDRRNNLESVFLEAPQDGRYHVNVRAVNLLAAASPNVDDLLWQDFALVVTNARLLHEHGNGQAVAAAP